MYVLQIGFIDISKFKHDFHNIYDNWYSSTECLRNEVEIYPLFIRITEAGVELTVRKSIYRWKNCITYIPAHIVNTIENNKSPANDNNLTCLAQSKGPDFHFGTKHEGCLESDI